MAKKKLHTYLVSGRGCENQRVQYEIEASDAKTARKLFAARIDETHVIDQVEKMESGKLVWRFANGVPGIQADLTYAGDYVISHRPKQFNVSYRPPGQHHHVGCFTTLAKAKKAAEAHHKEKTNG